MSYRLGIDLGTTFSAAAVARTNVASMVSLGIKQPEIPSVIAILEDEVLVGDPAERRAISDPEAIAREFKRRLGDPTPLIVGGSPWSAEALLGRVLAHIIDHVKDVEGGAAEEVIVTHPANWREFKLDRLRQAMMLAGCQNGTTIPEPFAAAQYYANQGRVHAGQVTAVFDFGGGTFDVAILHCSGDEFEIRGEPQGLEQLGGIDIDQAVLAHVLRHAEIDLNVVDDTPTNRRSMARLRLDCREAKETLSSDTSAFVPVMLPGKHTDVRLTRTEFEEMVRQPLNDAIKVVKLAIEGAGLHPREVDSVLLVGGSSRIPVVSQMIGEQLGLPVLTDAHPKHAVALGAATGSALSARVTPHEASSDPETKPLALPTSPESRVREPRPGPPTNDVNTESIDVSSSSHETATLQHTDARETTTVENVPMGDGHQRLAATPDTTKAQEEPPREADSSRQGSPDQDDQTELADGASGSRRKRLLVIGALAAAGIALLTQRGPSAEVATTTTASSVQTVTSSTVVDVVPDSETTTAQTAESLCIRHILLAGSDFALANELIAQLGSGADFEALAQEFSTGPSAANGGNLGCSDPNDYVAEVRDAVFDAPFGEIIGPVLSQFGLHIIRVDGTEEQLDNQNQAEQEQAHEQQEGQEIADQMNSQVELDPIQFATGTDVLLDASLPLLDQVAELLLAAPDINLEIQGYTDVRGDENANLALSQARADAVRLYLVGIGVDENRLVSVGYGETTEFAEGDTPAALAANRRIQFVQN